MRFKQKISHWINLSEIEYGWYNRYRAIYGYAMSFSQCVNAFTDSNVLYAYMHHNFRYLCPQIIRDHRSFFKQDERGFGEDAFHAMWWLLLSEFKPKRLLEIGVYRGQIISLWALIVKQLLYSAQIHGISPFNSLGDSVSSYLKTLDYMQDIRESFRYLGLDYPSLLRALSTDQQAIAYIQGNKWDLIYIDGSHEYDIVLSDYRLCRDGLKVGGILVLDDASVGSAFRPPRFSFAGHIGPSRVAREYADKEMQFLGMIGHNNVFRKIS
jgi:hypothetical protein